MGRDRLFPRKGLLRQKTPVYIHRQAVDPRTLPDGGAVVAGGAAAEGHRRIAKAYTRKYSDTEFLPSNFNPQPAAGRGRRIPVPLDMAAAANVYATNLPRLLGAATGRGKKMSEKDATNSILELLFASRMQNRTM
jgi:hypothetical protein